MGLGTRVLDSGGCEVEFWQTTTPSPGSTCTPTLTPSGSLHPPSKSESPGGCGARSPTSRVPRFQTGLEKKGRDQSLPDARTARRREPRPKCNCHIWVWVCTHTCGCVQNRSPSVPRENAPPVRVWVSKWEGQPCPRKDRSIPFPLTQTPSLPHPPFSMWDYYGPCKKTSLPIGKKATFGDRSVKDFARHPRRKEKRTCRVLFSNQGRAEGVRWSVPEERF